MGAWGTGTFDNDSALDWVAALEEDTGLDLVDRTLDWVLEIGSGYLEVDEGSNALAAAEVVASLLGHGNSPNPIDDWVTRVVATPSESLRQKAIKAVERVLAESSEVRELWEEGGESEDSRAWRSGVDDLLHRLRQH